MSALDTVHYRAVAFGLDRIRIHLLTPEAREWAAEYVELAEEKTETMSSANGTTGFT